MLLGFERRDHRRVDGRFELALEVAAPFDQQRDLPLSLLGDPLIANQQVAHVATAHGRQLGLSSQDPTVEVGQGGPEPLVLGPQSGLGPGGLLELALPPHQLPAGEVDPQSRQLRDQAPVASSGVGLTLERTQLPADLSEQVVDPGQVGLGGLKPTFGPLLATAVLQHARRLFDDEPALLGPGVEHPVDVPLRDDHVLLAADTAVGEELLDVEQPAGHPVDGVLAVAGAEQEPGDRHLGELDGQQPGRVVDGQRHLGPSELGQLGCAGEDDVVHLLGSDR